MEIVKLECHFSLQSIQQYVRFCDQSVSLWILTHNDKIIFRVCYILITVRLTLRKLIDK